jgi:hypothetical protein
MRESRTYGSVRGALSNERPYRDGRPFVAAIGVLRKEADPSAWAEPTRMTHSCLSTANFAVVHNSDLLNAMVGYAARSKGRA